MHKRTVPFVDCIVPSCTFVILWQPPPPRCILARTLLRDPTPADQFLQTLYSLTTTYLAIYRPQLHNNPPALSLDMRSIAIRTGRPSTP